MEKPIDRIVQFAKWAKEQKLVASQREFENRCGLTPRYLYNTSMLSIKGISTEVLDKVYSVFPQINLTWVVTGKGEMLTAEPADGYKKAYETAKKKLDAIALIVGE